jgi:hypothetical protein
MISQQQVQDVLRALGEEFLVDVPAEHDGKGGYKLDYFVLARALVSVTDEQADRIAGYINTQELTNA